MGLQVEDGKYTRIVNEVLEQLVKTALLASEFRIALFVIRKTWGYNKTEDVISLTQFRKGTGLSRTTIIAAIKNLTLKRLLVQRSVPPTSSKAYKFNKYWHEWVVQPVGLVQHALPELVRRGVQKLVQRSVPTKDNTKDKRQETVYEKLERASTIRFDAKH